MWETLTLLTDAYRGTDMRKGQSDCVMEQCLCAALTAQVLPIWNRDTWLLDKANSYFFVGVFIFYRPFPDNSILTSKRGGGQTNYIFEKWMHFYSYCNCRPISW